MSNSGAMDLCYINFKCDRQFRSVRAFNNIWSNIGYILLSILFIIITLTKSICYARYQRANGVPTTGLLQVFGMYYGLGIALFFEGILSGTYHLCPTLTTLQFDTTFMYVLLIMLSVRLYENRHPGARINPFYVFVTIFIIVMFTTLSLLTEAHSPLPTQIILTAGIILFTCIISHSIYTIFLPRSTSYYHRDWLRQRSIKLIRWPQYNKSRIFQLLCLLLADTLTLILLWTPGLIKIVSSAVLFHTAIILVLYCLYYWCAKMIERDFLHRPVVFSLALLTVLLSTACWTLAFYCWCKSPISPSETPSSARMGNRNCIFMDYYDHHDAWHILSAFGMFTLFLATLLVDENMGLVPRERIHVF